MPHPSGDPGVWVAALLTLCVFSFLYRDNPLYKLAEHLFVGVSAGYFIILNWWTVLVPNLIEPLGRTWRGEAGGPLGASLGDYRAWLLLPGLLGVMLFARGLGRLAWLARWPLALVLGVYAGLKATGFAQADLVEQVRGALIPLWVAGDWGATIDSWLLTVGLVTSLLYFFYSREHRGALGGVSRVGIAFLMVGFGAGYGYAVMSRVSLLIGRLQFLLGDWLGLR